MKPFPIILTLALISIFIVSCTGGNLAIQDTDIYKGTKGLRLDILESLPPKDMFVGSIASPAGFQIGIELENEGAKDIIEGIVSISYDTKYNKFIEPNSELIQIPFELRGRSDLTPKGDITRLAAIGENTGLPPGSTSVFVVSACYKYETIANINVCISPVYAPLLKVSDDVCSPKDFANIRLSGGQGAPVAIASVQESIRPREYGLIDIVFAITLDNVGGGVIRSEENYDKECRGNIALDVQDIRTAKVKEISFGQYSLSNGAITCNPGELRVGEKTIICTATLVKDNIPSAYITPLLIKIGYGYVAREYPTIKFKEFADIQN